MKRHVLRGLWAGCVCALVFSFSVPCWSQQQTGQAPQGNPEAARRHFMEGLAHYQQQDYQAALACFEDAYRAQPLPALLYNIAQCQIRLNRRADAVRTLERMLAQPGMQAHPQAQQLLNELRQQGAGAATSGGS